MKISKKTMFVFMLFSYLIANSQITIYNQGHAFVQEERTWDFTQKGKQSILVQGIPNAAYPSSINLKSEKMQFFSKEYLQRPISIQALLDANIGEELELVKYGEDGSITFTTTGKLISNSNKPVFEIDGKIVIAPPYSYRFPEIPDGIMKLPYLKCLVETASKNTQYTLSYITGGLNWESEYNLILTSEDKSEIEGWYAIRNDNDLLYENAEVSLVSGAVNFASSDSRPKYSQRKTTAMAFSGESAATQPVISQTAEYAVFHLPEKIDLAPKSQRRHIFLARKKLPYHRIYHISHSLQRYRSNKPADKNDIPVFVRLQLLAKDIGNFQIPGGEYKVFEDQNGELTYIGTGSSPIAEGDDKIKIETGRTHEIKCQFTIEGFRINKDTGEAELNAVFENRKNKAISIEWTEQFSDGRWDITNSNIEYEQLDAFRALFIVNVPAGSKKEISFKARIEKN